MEARRRTREARDGEQNERHVPVHSVVRALVRGLARRGAGIAELAEEENKARVSETHTMIAARRACAVPSRHQRA